MKKKVIEGKYATADIFATVIEEEAVSQIETLCNEPFTQGSKIAVMPDVHSGAGCVIGLTMTLDGKACPNLVGVDIGCGVKVVELGKIDIDFEKLDKIIHCHIPYGIDNRSLESIEELKSNLSYRGMIESAIDNLNSVRAPINYNYELERLGSLGSGNHYIEIDTDSEGNKYLTIHTGSRHLGVSICNHYMEVANEKRKGSLTERNNTIKNYIADCKKLGKQQEIEAGIDYILKTFKISEPSNLAYVEGKDYEDYLWDMNRAQQFAECNRNLIAKIICDEMGWLTTQSWTTLHNYIDMERNILRKGSISLENGTKAIIPINMRDGALIVVGKGNSDYNYSGPHGAGRLMSRNEARKSISLEDFKKSMEGVYSTSVNTDTIDESPMAYKCKDDILPMLEDTAEVISNIKPIYNFKGSLLR